MVKERGFKHKSDKLVSPQTQLLPALAASVFTIAWCPLAALGFMACYQAPNDSAKTTADITKIFQQ